MGFGVWGLGVGGWGLGSPEDDEDCEAVERHAHLLEGLWVRGGGLGLGFRVLGFGLRV